MGDYVLKVCKFIPLYFKNAICNIPAKNYVAVLQCISIQLPFSEQTSSCYPRLNKEKEKALSKSRAQNNI